MGDGIANSESARNNYVYGRFQRTTSYDPNMCTTAARFSPYYGKRNSLPPQLHQDQTNPSQSAQNKSPNHNDIASSASYLTYHQNPNSEMPNSIPVPFNEQTTNVDGSCEIDYIQQMANGSNGQEITTATSIVMHRSPNGHLYQNFYVANDGDNPEEIVQLIPIDAGGVTHLVDSEGDNYALSYEFPQEHQIGEMIESQSQHPIESAEEQIMTSGILNRDQQRILLESTMSPLLAAVNDITQRDKHFLSCLNDHSIEENEATETGSNEGINQPQTDSSEEDDDDYILVSDRTIESRARASLPTNYLYLGPINADTNEPSVFAARKIIKRTKFGPFEGEIRSTNDIFLDILRSQQPRHFPLLLVGTSRILIVTNENTSNWMRFVRLAQTFAEQNLEIIEENDRIFFKCNRDILPKEELRVGYHCSYAQKYDLPVFVPSLEDTQKKYERDNPWMCFECDQRFPTSQEMQTHLKVHDLEDASCVISKRKFKRKRTKFRKVSELPKNSSRCLICFKVFMTNASLKKHFALHLAANKAKAKTKALKEPIKNRLLQKCSLCSKRFSSEDKLKLHKRTHTVTAKPHKCPHCDQQCSTPTALAAHIRSHTSRLYSCIYCQETFHYVLDFKQHVLKHRIDGLFSCFHCKKNYKEYRIVRRHIRMFHPAVKYPCNECDRLFLHMSFLRRHKATHAKQQTNQCLQCEAKFQKTTELRKHIKTHHKTKANMKTKMKKSSKPPKTTKITNTNRKMSPKKDKPTNRQPPLIPASYLQSQFKCETCRLGFKRRGMLVNHLVKRHPEQNIDAIEELNQPIVKLQTMFKCPHCPKIYKNNAKRKGHILKNHPGLQIPPSFRKVPIQIDPNVQTVGSIKADVQKCHLCYKQYVTKMRLVMHYRKAHPDQSITQMVQHEKTIIKNQIIEEPCIEPTSVLSFYRPIEPPPPPVSPENKLLKLSSAALELSSIEDRKYFDFLNERSDATEMGNRNSFKMIGVDSEFVESSSNADAELNRLPELFDESIACI